MGFLKPDIEAHQPKSQATPLSSDILQMLREAIKGGTFGEGLGSQQKAAGEGVERFIGARETPEQFLELMGPLREQFARETERGVAGQRESLGLTGNRFSESLLREEGRFRRERGTDIDALMSNLFLQDQGNLLSALGLQGQLGQQATQPFFDFASLGIRPEETVVSDSPWVTFFKLMTEGAKGVGTAAAGA